MRVNVDMDGVLVDLGAVWYPWIYEKYGVRLTKKNVKQWNIEDLPGLDKGVREFLFIPGIFKRLPEVCGAIEAVNRLCHLGHHIQFVTHAVDDNEIIKYGKLEWLKDKFYWFREDMVTFTSDKSMVGGDILIDDRTEFLKQWSKTNPDGRAVAFDHPYNRDWKGDRVSSWKEFLELVTRLEELDYYDSTAPQRG